MKINSHFSPSRLIPLNQPNFKGSRMVDLFKTALLGLLLFRENAFATKDLCNKSNMREFCRGNLGIPRSDMPQVEDEVRDAYLYAKFSQGYKIESKLISPHLLTATQCEISHSIMMDMVKARAHGYFDPCERSILVARNQTHYNIMDGHHTASACRIANGKQNAVVIEDPQNRVLGELQQLSGGFRRNLDDSVTKP